MNARAPSRTAAALGRQGAIAIITTLAAFATFGSCNNSFSPASKVENLRVLAVRAEPPELRPGQSADITTLIADPRGGGREVTVVWGVCNPGLVTDLLKCQNPRFVTPLGAGPSVRVTAPADYLDNPGGAPRQKRFLILVGAATAGDEQRVFTKELVVRSDAEPLNKNPTLVDAALTTLSADGGPGALLVSTASGVEAQVSVTVGAMDHETYTEAGKTETEELTIAYFATAGEMDANRTVDTYTNGWVAPAQPERVTFWVVVRDGRNGTDWRTFSIDVR